MELSPSDHAGQICPQCARPAHPHNTKQHHATCTAGHEFEVSSSHLFVRCCAMWQNCVMLGRLDAPEEECNINDKCTKCNRAIHHLCVMGLYGCDCTDAYFCSDCWDQSPASLTDHKCDGQGRAQGANLGMYNLPPGTHLIYHVKKRKTPERRWVVERYAPAVPYQLGDKLPPHKGASKGVSSSSASSSASASSSSASSSSALGKRHRQTGTANREPVLALPPPEASASSSASVPKKRKVSTNDTGRQSATQSKVKQKKKSKLATIVRTPEQAGPSQPTHAKQSKPQNRLRGKMRIRSRKSTRPVSPQMNVPSMTLQCWHLVYRSYRNIPTMRTVNSHLL